MGVNPALGATLKGYFFDYPSHQIIDCYPSRIPLMVIVLLLFAVKLPIVNDSPLRTVTSTLLFMTASSPGVSAINPPAQIPELDKPSGQYYSHP